MANVTERATAAARLLARNDNHPPIKDSDVPEQHRAWCARELLDATTTVERTDTSRVDRATARAALAARTHAVRLLLAADVACQVPVLPARFEHTEHPQLALAI